MLKSIICCFALICAVITFSTEARADDDAPCTTTASGPYFSWSGLAQVKITVQCEAPVSTIQITNGQWRVDYDDPRYTDVGATGLSKTCSNVDKCELWMNLGSPYSVPGRTSVTTWSASSSYPSGSSFASATWDPYP